MPTARCRDSIEERIWSYEALEVHLDLEYGRAWVASGGWRLATGAGYIENKERSYCFVKGFGGEMAFWRWLLLYHEARTRRDFIDLLYFHSESCCPTLSLDIVSACPSVPITLKDEAMSSHLGRVLTMSGSMASE